MTILYTAKKKALAVFTSAILLHTLHNPNAYGTNDNIFGKAVAISGNLAIVGAYGEGEAGGSYAGKAYVYQIS